jgi:FtsH-binding integral membrane protein
MIIEKAAGGDRDHIWHAIELFIDFVEIFYRLVVILMKNAQQKSSDDKRKRR